MATRFLQSSIPRRGNRGHTLLTTVIILALLGALGVAGLNGAHVNMRAAANERDAKDAFFQADSGVNLGHVFLEEAITEVNSSVFDDGTTATNATHWEHSVDFDTADYPLAWDSDAFTGTFVRFGVLRRMTLPGAAAQTGGGYEGPGLSSAGGGAAVIFLIRAHRAGSRGSHAEVDLGWEHVIR